MPIALPLAQVFVLPTITTEPSTWVARVSGTSVERTAHTTRYIKAKDLLVLLPNEVSFRKYSCKLRSTVYKE
ncbi:hypothetical protein F5Y09DRAFT_316647 [Xylaria sp. FL1042]|nr:hypothetical protein F5Y09DRAFT_316647 [Xylaria sp. FL1042]